MAVMSSPHSILGLSPDASPDAVRAAFRAVAKSSHPDVTSDPSAQARFLEVQQAYREITRGAASADNERLPNSQSGNPRMARMTEIELPVSVWIAMRGGTVKGSCALGRASVRIPKGTRSGDRIVAKIGARDVAFVARLGDSDGFRPEGADVSMVLKVPAILARSGGQTRIDTPTGPLHVRLPQGTETGMRLKVDGHGLPGSNERPAGALYLDIEIMETVTDRAVAALDRILKAARRPRQTSPSPRRQASSGVGTPPGA
jgi:curved DNA-binding protein